MHWLVYSVAYHWFVFVPSEQRQREDFQGNTLLKVRHTHTQDEQNNNFRLFSLTTK